MAYEKKPYYKRNNWSRKDEKPIYKPKRGPLKPLMTEEDKKVCPSIQNLSYDYACRITRLFQYLTEDAEYREFIFSKQIVRSGTSIAANMNEAKHPQSDADFLSKSSIALKEARETEFWLNLLHDNGYINDSQFTSLNNDLDRILRILVTITTKVRERLKEEKKKSDNEIKK